MVEILDHSDNCCAHCAAKIDATYDAIKKISDFVGSINLDDLGKNPVFKMLGLGKK